jgi:hypothetical protein
MKNKKVIRLSENDLEKIVRRIINEAEVDMYGKVCKKCKKGKYRETSHMDDLEGVLHCDKCGEETERYLNEATNTFAAAALELVNIAEPMVKGGGYVDDMRSEEDLLLKVYELAEIMGHGEDSEMPLGDFSDLSEAAVYLEDEMYDGNHGSIIEKEIHDLLTQIYEIIGYPDEEEFDEEGFDEEEFDDEY